ncbi:MAG: Glu/Leu/Phe/Val dehydrogenase dimerization domain-containing protein [Pseudomonadota bacterium]
MRQEELNVEGYCKVVRFQDDASGLDAIVSIHSDAIGPGLGGCRMFPYASFEDGLDDVLRLSKGMTYKNALAGIPFGGGKSVIFGNPRSDKTPRLFPAFGAAVNAMAGLYYGAQDSGVDKADLDAAAGATRYIAGLGGPNGEGGDPSPFTAYGVWRGVEAAVRHKLGSDLKGVRVIVMGLGHVGMELARLLHKGGASLIVADIDPARVEEAKSRFGATGAHYQEAFAQDADVYAPCALGGAINPTTVQHLKVKVVAGAANNQLQSPEMGAALNDRGVLYAPDYIVNAGGVISVGQEVIGGWTKEKVYARLDKIGVTIKEVFARADRDGRRTDEVANAMAEEIIAAGAAPRAAAV